MDNNQFDKITKKCREILKCETARISKPKNRMFLIIGTTRKAETYGHWIPIHDFDFLIEQTVASGKTEEELLVSVREYKRLCDMTSEEYLHNVLHGGYNATK